MAIDAEQYLTTTDTGTYRAGSDIEEYHALALTGERTVEPITDGTSAEFTGMAVTSADSGEEVGSKSSNQSPVQVTNPDGGTVAAGAHLVPSGTAGVLRPLNTGGATGESAEDADVMAITDEDADGLVTALHK
jgi:hypothetical protein